MNGVFSPISAAAASPPTGRTGGIYYDSTNDKLQYYNGSSWGDIGGGGSSLWTAGSGYIYPTTSSVNILPNTTGEIGSSDSPWAAVYGSVLYAATRISMKYSATYYQAFSLNSSTEISCSLPFIPSSDDAKWLGTPSSRWARIWGVGGYFGAADSHVLCYRGSSSQAVIQATGNSASVGLVLQTKNAMPITLNDIAVLAGGAQTNLGIYIGLFAANQLLDDSTHGTGSTTLYIGDETIDTTASDRRMKKNIVDSSVDTFKILDKMRIVDFEWKSGRTGKYTGLIAQEVDEYLPQVVKKPSNPEEIGWAVEYHHLVPYLILALKKLDERVKELEFIAQKSNDKTEIEV